MLSSRIYRLVRPALFHFLQRLGFHLDAHPVRCRGSSPTAGRRHIDTSRSQYGKMIVLDQHAVAE